MKVCNCDRIVSINHHFTTDLIEAPYAETRASLELEVTLEEFLRPKFRVFSLLSNLRRFWKGVRVLNCDHDVSINHQITTDPI